MDGGEEGSGVFGVSGGDTAPALEGEKGVFDQVAQFVEVFIIRPLHGSVFLRRDNRIHALNGGLLKNGIRLIPFIRDQVVGAYAFDQAACLCAIRSGTFCNNNSDRQTMPIHGQMYLSVEPPFVRLMSWFPPLAPAAWGWTLQ